MFQVPSLVAALGLALCLLASHKTQAQQPRESGVVYEAARNKIGLIRYCRKQALLDTATAEQALTAMEAGLRKLPASGAKEAGDLAQQAGEEGFWDVGRKHDLASIAKLFGTTQKDLCHEWAGDTLRARAPTPHRASAVARAQPAPAERPQVEDDSRAATAALPAVPPLPEKAPPLPSEAELVSLQRTLPRGGHPGSSGRAGSLPASSRAADAEERPRGQTATTGETSHHAADQPPSLWHKWFFNRLGKTGRCFMPGCKWQAP